MRKQTRTYQSNNLNPGKNARYTFLIIKTVVTMDLENQRRSISNFLINRNLEPRNLNYLDQINDISNAKKVTREAIEVGKAEAIASGSKEKTRTELPQGQWSGLVWGWYKEDDKLFFLYKLLS